MTTRNTDASTADAPPKRHYILGTAGHIDHGKTTLIEALTGIDTDRLPEEQRRGMTIELGFASLAVDDCVFGIVDVPGHERFVRTMVSGATGIDLALIVVAADDSVMPQTREHVEILHLLGIDRGVVAITKCDTVDEEMVELVRDDVDRLLQGTLLDRAPIVPVSAITGMGLAELRTTLSRGLEPARYPPSPEHSRGLKPAARREERPPDTRTLRGPPAVPFRIAIDRVFTVQGRGTVVTGSVQRGRVSDGDILEVWPGGATCRVRGLQTHGADTALVARGQRAAINLTGIDRAQIPRGAELATPGYLTPSHMADVRIECLPSYQRPLKSTSVVRFELGATEIPTRVVLLEEPTRQPGNEATRQRGNQATRQSRRAGTTTRQATKARRPNGAAPQDGAAPVRKRTRKIANRQSPIANPRSSRWPRARHPTPSFAAERPSRPCTASGLSSGTKTRYGRSAAG